MKDLIGLCGDGVMICMASLAIVVTIVLLASWIDSLFQKHKWDYGRNPYRRVCRKCGLQQDYMDPGGWEDRAFSQHSPELCEKS